MALPDPRPGSVPFTEAIDFFRAKLNIPTRAWTDLWEGEHSAGFMVAGAMKQELLADLREAVDKYISQGTTMAAFRRDFAQIVRTHGWSYKGGFGWRSRLIATVNARSAVAAGKWQQAQRLKATRPFLRYVAVLDARTRPLHREWHGTILPVDHDWWATHYPPNGWNCRCTVRSLSQRDVDKNGWKLPAQAPASPLTMVDVPGRGPVQVPEGIDPGFGYNPGRAGYGAQLDQQTLDAWRNTGEARFTRLTPGDWQSAGRPEQLPARTPQAGLDKEVTDRAGLTAQIAHHIGGDTVVLRTPADDPVHISAEALANHLDISRAPFVSLLREAIENPEEIWLAFEKSNPGGKVVLRQRLVTQFALDQDRTMLVILQAVRGRLEAWTMIPGRLDAYTQRQRVGQLLYARGSGVEVPPNAAGGTPGGG